MRTTTMLLVAASLWSTTANAACAWTSSPRSWFECVQDHLADFEIGDVGALLTTSADHEVRITALEGGTLVSSFPSSCGQLLAEGETADGVYTIDPDGGAPARPVDVYCDMSGGGWTRVELYTRYWGAENGVATDPHGGVDTFGERFQGAGGKGDLANLDSCSGDSPVPLTWYSEGVPLADAHIRAFNLYAAEFRVDDPYYAYDADGNADRDQLKGCIDDEVVMTGDGDEFGTGASEAWAGPYAFDTVDGLFTLGIYGGNGGDGGTDMSLPRYWYVR